MRNQLMATIHIFLSIFGLAFLIAMAIDPNITKVHWAIALFVWLYLVILAVIFAQNAIDHE